MVASPPVSDILKFAVSAGIGRMVQPILLPVIRIPTAPCSLAVMSVLLVVGVGRHLRPLPQPFPYVLAGPAAAVVLVLDAWIGER